MFAPKIIVARTTVSGMGYVSREISCFDSREAAVASIKALGPEIKSRTDEAIKKLDVCATAVCCPSATSGGSADYFEEYKIVYLSYWTGNEASLVAIHHIIELPTLDEESTTVMANKIISMLKKTRGIGHIPDTDLPNITKNICAILSGKTIDSAAAPAVTGFPLASLAGKSIETGLDLERKFVSVAPAPGEETILQKIKSSDECSIGGSNVTIVPTYAEIALEKVKKIYATKVNLSWSEFCQIQDIVSNVMTHVEQDKLGLFCHTVAAIDPTRSDVIGLYGYINFRCFKITACALEMLNLAAEMGDLPAMKNLLELYAEELVNIPQSIITKHINTLTDANYFPSTLGSTFAEKKVDASTTTSQDVQAGLAALAEVKKIYGTVGTEVKPSWSEANRIGNLIRNVMGHLERDNLLTFCTVSLAKDSTRSDLIGLQGYMMFRCFKDHRQACEKLSRAAAMGNLLAMADLLCLHYETEVSVDEPIYKYEQILTEAGYYSSADRYAVAKQEAKSALAEVKRIFFTTDRKVSVSCDKTRRISHMIHSVMGEKDRSELHELCIAALKTNPRRADIADLQRCICHPRTNSK
jgi:hypothetical protein